MNVSTAIATIKRHFGDEFGVVMDNDDIYSWIHDAELDIIRTTGCNDTKVSFPSSAYPIEIPLIVNIKRIGVAGKALQYIGVEELDLLAMALNDTGSSQYWYKQGSSVYLWPISNKTITTEVVYSKSPAMMSGNPPDWVFTVPDVYHDDIIKYCLARAHNKNNNLQGEAAQMSLYDKTLTNRRDEAQSADTTLYKIGDPDDFMDYN